VTQLASPTTAGAFGVLLDVVAAGNAVVLSGAGLSTESGIPDYRGPTGLARRATPMTYQTFTASPAARLTSSSKDQASTASSPGRNAYPGGDATRTCPGAHAPRPGSSRRRSRETCDCTAACAPGGASPA